MMWHVVWVDFGRPHDGIVVNIMRRTRASYHYAVRMVKNCKLDMVKERFATAIIDNKDRDFWREAKISVEAKLVHQALWMLFAVR